MAIRRIVVGIDGSANATNAFAWAVGFAHAEGAALEAIHAWQSPLVCISPWAPPSPEQEVRHAQRLIHETVGAVGTDTPVETIILQGAGGPSLTAGSKHADLLVIGRTGRDLATSQPKIGQVLAGGTTHFCINHAQIPVAAVPEGASWVEAPRVVVGIDGSARSIAALRWAADNVPADATILALQAVSLGDADSGTPPDAELLDPLADALRQALRELVDANLPPAFVSAGRTVGTRVVLGYADDALTDPGLGCDLVVIGEHGETAAAPGVLGAVADHTLRHSPVPVVVVRSPAVAAPNN